jgi:glycosyltransferase involved in cell wall biosynthesis
MRVAFLDPTTLDYTVETPQQRPLGGSQSALCYLAIELAARGHSISVINNTSTPGRHRDVNCTHFSLGLSTTVLNGFDVVIVSNQALGTALRRKYGVTVPLVLWTGDAHGEPALRPLADPHERAAWQGFAFVSEWQRDAYARAYDLPHDKSRILRNAISPAFAALEPPPPWFARGDVPVLVYTSTPFRGLDVLLRAFPAIRAGVRGARLRVFSSMAIYQIPSGQDQYAKLYRQCATTKGVDYVGPVGQQDLAREVAGAAALAYPCTFAETSCIAALEAMATGALVLTTSLGALPETTGGFARMVEPQADRARLAKDFGRMAIEALGDLQRNPDAAAARRQEQIAFVRQNYAWPARAAEWVAWLSGLAGKA